MAIFPFYNFPIGVLPSVPGPNDLLMKLTFEADKSDPCTAQSCVPEDCLDDDDCDDGNVCNGTETCQLPGGVCRAGTPLVCNDSNFCNGAEWCDERQGCQLGTPPSCADNDRCTDDLCDVQAGRCVFVPADDCCLVDADCEDDDVCTGEEKCVSGRCQIINGTVPSCDDGNKCTEDGCNPSATDPTTACTHASLPDGHTCSDGNVCNGDEVCLAGGCMAGIALTCDDGVTCTENKCHAFLGCYNPPIENCCLSAADCDDQTVCNGIEKSAWQTPARRGRRCRATMATPATAWRPAIRWAGACRGRRSPALTRRSARWIRAIRRRDAWARSSRDAAWRMPTATTATPATARKPASRVIASPEARPCATTATSATGSSSAIRRAAAASRASRRMTSTAVICTLNAIQKKLQDVGYVALGGRVRAKGFTKLVVGARRTLQLAGRGSGPFGRGMIGKTQNRVEKFIHRLRGNESRGRIEPVLSQDLTDMAASTRPLLVRLAVNAPVP